MVKPSIFPRRGYANSHEEALALCESAGNRALFLPEIAQARIAGDLPWNNYYGSRSLRVTGTSKGGSKVVLYVHTDHPLATSEGVRRAKRRGFVNGAARFPQESFLQLLEHDGEKADDGTYRVKAVLHQRLRESPSDFISIDDALAHPQTIPFLGSEDVAKQYLGAFRSAYRENKIGIWHIDDFNEDSPLARPLFVGDNDVYGGGLDGDYGFGYDGRVVGVRAIASTAPKKILR